MKPFPHVYATHAIARPSGDVVLEDGPRVNLLLSNSPPEFDGPDDRWSPETLLVSAVGGCLLLTFRAIAAASKLPYESAWCRVEGRLDRVDNVTAFVGFAIQAQVTVGDESDVEKARAVMVKAEKACLISNSLRAPCTLHVEVATTTAVEEVAAVRSR